MKQNTDLKNGQMEDLDDYYADRRPIDEQAPKQKQDLSWIPNVAFVVGAVTLIVTVAIILMRLLA